MTTELKRLQKQLQDKDQAILLLNELLNKTDQENAELKQQALSMEAAQKAAREEGWRDCEEHQKAHSGDHLLDDDYRPSMPWTSQNPPLDFDDRAGSACIHCLGVGHGPYGGRCAGCNGRGWQ